MYKDMITNEYIHRYISCRDDDKQRRNQGVDFN